MYLPDDAFRTIMKILVNEGEGEGCNAKIDELVPLKPKPQSRKRCRIIRIKLRDAAPPSKRLYTSA